MDESSEKTNQINRRGFLKGIMAVGGSVALRKPIKYLESQKPQVEKLNFPENSYETSNAYYVPLTERHDKHTNEINKLLSFQIKLDSHFNEGIQPTINILDAKPISILLSEGKSPIHRTWLRYFPDEILIHFAQEDTYINKEGSDLPPHLYFAHDVMLTAEFYTGYNLLLNAIKDKLATTEESKGKRDNKIDATSFLKSLGIAWLITPGTASVVSYLLSIDSAERSEVLKSIGEITERISNVGYHTHPELMSYFFRNIMMARKLELLAEELPKLKKPERDKPIISYSVGKSHGGLKDLIQVDDKTNGNFTLSLLSIYPEPILKNIVLYNHLERLPKEHMDGEQMRKAINTFCSTVIVPVKANLEGQEVKHVVVDEELKRYLESRLLEPESKH